MSTDYPLNDHDYVLPSMANAPAVIKMDLYSWKLTPLAPVPHSESYRREIILECNFKSCRYWTMNPWPIKSTNLRSHWIKKHEKDYRARDNAFKALKNGSSPQEARSIAVANASTPPINSYFQASNTNAGNSSIHSVLPQNFGNQVVFDPHHYRALGMKFLSNRNLPFTTADSVDLGNWLEYARLCPTPNLPTISRYIMREQLYANYITEREKLKQRLGKLNSKVAITIDEWKSGNNLDFCGITLHFNNENFRLESYVIGFEIMNERESYTGDFLSEILNRVLDEYEIRLRIISITRDNASPMDLMMKDFAADMKTENVEFDGDIRCVGHVLNLITCSILNYTFLKPVKSTKLRETIKRVEELDKKKVNRARKTAKKVFSIVKSVRENTSLKNRFAKLVTTKKQLEGNNNGPEVLLRNNETRWLSTYKMLNRFFYFRKEIHKLLDRAGKENSTKRANFNLKSYTMSKSDWEHITLMRQILSIFEQATIKLQGDTYHTVGLTIPYVSQILMAIDEFDTPALEEKNPLLILGIRDAREKLLKYYPLRDSNIDRLKHLYLATVLDPRLMLHALRDSGLSIVTIEEIESHLNMVFERYKRVYERSQRSSGLSPQTNRRENRIFTSNISKNIFARRENGDNNSEISRYFAEDRPLEDCDVGKWYEKRRDSYPVLFMMAKDYLCSPAMSAPAERLFSQSKCFITEKRHRLLHDAIKMLAISKSRGVIPDDKLDGILEEKNTSLEANDQSKTGIDELVTRNPRKRTKKSSTRRGIFADIIFNPNNSFYDDREEEIPDSDDGEDSADDSPDEDASFYHGFHASSEDDSEGCSDSSIDSDSVPEHSVNSRGVNGNFGYNEPNQQTQLISDSDSDLNSDVESDTHLVSDLEPIRSKSPRSKRKRMS